MSKSGSLYIHRDSLFHRLDGSVKFLMLISWTVFAFMFLDARVFAVMICLGFAMLKVAKLPLKIILPLAAFVFVFTVFNSIFLILVTPEYGSKLVGRYTVALNIFDIRVTYETLFYVFTLSLKYFSMLPITLLFVLTTEPSSFASSLNRLGVSYKVAYGINIALRYIPDVREEMMNIINAQEARGVAFRKGEASVFKRMRNYVTVLLPLLLSSLHRIETVSIAMDLRGFGKDRTRTWYNRQKLQHTDFLYIALSVFLVLIGIYLKYHFSSKFWYAF